MEASGLLNQQQIHEANVIIGHKVTLPDFDSAARNFRTLMRDALGCIVQPEYLC